MTDISDYVNLVQLMDYSGNVNHAISDFGYWIFDSNHKRALVIHRSSLDMICASSIGEEQVAKFELIFDAVRYICLDARLK